MATKTGDFREVEPKLVLEPVYSIAGAAGKNTDEVVPGELSCLQSKKDELKRPGRIVM